MIDSPGKNIYFRAVQVLPNSNNHILGQKPDVHGFIRLRMTSIIGQTIGHHWAKGQEIYPHAHANAQLTNEKFAWFPFPPVLHIIILHNIFSHACLASFCVNL